MTLGKAFPNRLHVRPAKTPSSLISLRCPFEDALYHWLLTKSSWRIWSNCANAKDDLSLRRAHVHSCWKCYAPGGPVQLLYNYCLYLSIIVKIAVQYFCTVTWRHSASLCLDKSNKRALCTQHKLRSAWASTQSDQSSLCAQWVAKDPRFLYADSEDSDQTGRMPRLIFAGRTCHFVGFVMWWLICANGSAFLNHKHVYIWATMWHVRPTRTQISLRFPAVWFRVFVVLMKKHCTNGYRTCAQCLFWSDCANAQAY